MGSMAKKIARTIAKKQAVAAQAASPAPAPRADGPVPRGKGRADSDEAAREREERAVGRLMTRLETEVGLAVHTLSCASKAGQAPWNMLAVFVHEDAREARTLFGLGRPLVAAEGDGGYLWLEDGRYPVGQTAPRLDPGGRSALATAHKKAMRAGGTRCSVALFIHDDGHVEALCYALPRAERAQSGEATYADENVGQSDGFDGA